MGLASYRLRSDGEGHTKTLQQSAGSVVSGRRCDDRYVHALQLVALRIVDLSEDELIAQAERVVAAAVEALRGHAAEVADAGKSDRDKAIQELIHRVATQRDHRADGHGLSTLEGRDVLLRLSRSRLLSGDGSHIPAPWVLALEVLCRFGERH